MGLFKSIRKKTYKNFYKIKSIFNYSEISKKKIIITGANSGIGLALIKNLEKKNTILAIVNNNKKNLEEIKSDNIQIIECDLSNLENLEIHKKILNNFSSNIIIHSAAIFGSTEQDLFNLNLQNFSRIININALSLLKIVQICFNHKLEQIINISSEMGSITKNEIGSFYEYRLSKSLLNSINKNLSIDLKKNKVITYAIHPGSVNTKMNPSGLLNIDTCAKNIIVLIAKKKKSFNGCFLNLDGRIIEW